LSYSIESTQFLFEVFVFKSVAEFIQFKLSLRISFSFVRDRTGYKVLKHNFELAHKKFSN
jgi:hypothetical protein